jgi:hypothetical protein
MYLFRILTPNREGVEMLQPTSEEHTPRSSITLQLTAYLGMVPRVCFKNYCKQSAASWLAQQ